MRIIDLSFPIRSGMPVFPGDPEVQIGHALTVESDTVAVSALALGSHSGTHIDAPAHTVEGGATIDAFALADLIGEAAHLRVRRPADLARVDAATIESPLPDRLPHSWSSPPGGMSTSGRNEWCATRFSTRNLPASSSLVACECSSSTG